MGAEPLTLGYSPCPNDTFIFHALVHGLLGAAVPPLAEPVLADVETLNEWALQGRLDVTKISCHALGHVLDKYQLLDSGAALGRGCGPLLVAAAPLPLADLAARPIAIPGRLTTAAMLLRLFAPACTNLVPMRFDLIMPAIAAGEVAAGVIIHESRFTYRQHNLVCLRDLGDWWEEVSGAPIPLGCIVARRSLGDERLAAIERGIRRSVELAFADPNRSHAYTKSLAQELDDGVIANHIALYVNDFSLSLGSEGHRAIDFFLSRGKEIGLIPS